MKKLIYVLLATLICLALVSCGENAGDKNDDVINVPICAVDGIEEYKVVRSENASEDETNVAVDLHQTLYKVIDGIKISTDYNSAAKEILVGNTNRKESIAASEGLRYHDYVVKKVGEKIVIAGGSTEALQAAVDLFKESFIDYEQGRVLIPIGEGYTYSGAYIMDKLSIEGTDISEFKIYNNSYMAKDDILAELHNAFGISFEFADEMTEGEHYLILDGTELIADKYSITIGDGNITIHGSAHSLPEAVKAFSGSYLEELGKKEYDLKAKDSIEGSTGKKEIYTKDQLMTVIEQVYADPDIVIVGEQLPGKTRAGIFEETVLKYEDETGEKPGIIGVDLACYGIDLMETDDLSWSSYICDMVDYCADGGIITISAHWENPSGNYGDKPRVRGNFGYVNTLEGYQQAFTDLITEGTEYNTFFKKELDENIRFLKALQDNGVPVIWRPLHEANGNFFWFCIRQSSITLDASYFVNVWKYVYEYFSDSGMENLIWCYAPNYSTNVDNKHGYHMSNTYLYPGDEYCDMVGVDWYSGGELEITTNNNYRELVNTANKPSAITEFGPGGDILAETHEGQSELYNCMDLYGNLYQLSKEGYSFVYVMTWTGDSSVSVLGEGEEYLAQEMTLGQAEVKAMFEALK
ncbi:MAG: hypothetical protein IJZ89_04170 [Clostridia bacterium]|nr:hypothetical protein [Clostridia bacterium]